MLVFEISQLLFDLVNLLLVHFELLLILPLKTLVRFIKLLALLGQSLVLQLQLVKLALHSLNVQLELLLNADVLPNITLQVLYDFLVFLGRSLSRGHVGARRLRNVLLLVYHDVCRAHAIHCATNLRGAMTAAAAIDVVVIIRPRLVLGASLLLTRPVHMPLLQDREVLFELQTD